ncbi:MAG: hypothetical protein WC988_02555 [Patescibacteria group bacterium]
MVTGSLQGTLVFKIFVLLSLLFVITDRAYAAPWFTTYGAGVLSGSSSTDSVKSVQPDFGALEVFKSTLIQPGTANPTLIPPDNTYDFSYGGILSSGDYEVFKSDGTTDTIDAYAKNLGALGSALPDYQRFVDIAVDVSTVCGGSCNNILTSCNIAPGIYKAGLNCINSALNSLPSPNYNYSINSSGLVVLVQNDNPANDFLKVNNKITSSAPDKRLALIMRNKIIIDSSVGNTNVPTQLGYLSQDADIQAMLITTFDGDPGVEVDGGSNRIKIEGPIISKGKVSFKRDAGSAWPGVFVQFNPFYTAEFAKLDESLNIFGSSSARWSYE